MTDTGFNRPDLGQLIDRVRADINARLPGAEARLRRSVLGVFARAIAGLAHGLYGYLKWISRQAIVDTADHEALEGWARVWGINRKGGERSTGTITATGVNGSIIPAGARLQSPDGIEYEVIAASEIISGEAVLNVRAIDVGDLGGLAAGIEVSFVSPVAGVDEAATVSGDGIGGGADVEDDESLRARILDRIQRPPHGGAQTDYERWAREVPGVTRAWVASLELGAGTVTVRFAMDESYPDGIPQAADVTAVQDYIDAPGRRPVTAQVTVVAPIPAAIDVTIAGLSPATPDVKANVEAELRDALFRGGSPGGTVRVSKLWEAISVAAGEDHHIITFPAADITLPTGNLPVLGTVTYA